MIRLNEQIVKVWAALIDGDETAQEWARKEQQRLTPDRSLVRPVPVGAEQ